MNYYSCGSDGGCSGSNCGDWYSCCQTITLYFDIIAIVFILHGDNKDYDSDINIVNDVVVVGII